MAASQPWAHQKPQDWTPADVDRVLLASPWAQQAGVIFGIKADEDPGPAQLPSAATAGLAGASASQPRWDGGVGRPDKYNVPTLNVIVRWDSALPERLAAARLQGTKSSYQVPYTTADAEKYYILTIIGLVPAQRYKPAAQTDSPSASDTSLDPANPAPMLQEVMANSRLLTHAMNVRALDAKLDASTGTLHVFFPRSQEITLNDKEVMLRMRFGSVSLAKKFRLKDMVYDGKLEL
ncbi:MAG: hypothetical protein JO319_08905 [Acidobacteriaceae bacterium]|nr:hypothetical protein [Acidobacteriaceae bacterium]